MTNVIQIAVAIVQDPFDRFLVGQRGPDQSLAGLAEFPGGKVEPEESILEAAQRECEEETGCRVQAQQVICEQVETYPHGTVQLHFVACRLVQLGPLEATSFRWHPRADLAKLPFPQGNQEVVRRLTQALD